MRIHFHIAADEKAKSINLRLLDQSLSHSVLAHFAKHGDVTDFTGITLPSLPGKEVNRILIGLRKLSVGASPTADQLVAALIKNFGRQVVWDERLNKFRNVSTMKEGDNLYIAKGVTPTITVTAKDETRAANRLVAKITERMSEYPKEAATLAEWFAAGRPIEQVESGKLPDVVDLKVLGGRFAKGEVVKPEKRITVKAEGAKGTGRVRKGPKNAN